MLAQDDICRAAAKVKAYLAVQGQEADIMPLLHPLGIDDEAIAHMIRHVFDLGTPAIEPQSFICGVLITAVAVIEPDGEALTPMDEFQLLCPDGA